MDHDIKFLDQQNPPEQSRLSILLSKQVLKSRVCNVLEACGHSFASIVYTWKVLWSFNCPVLPQQQNHLQSPQDFKGQVPNREQRRIGRA
ncbi:hypothetical protein Tco_1523430 [Tanacetum coccineum]